MVLFIVVEQGPHNAVTIEVHFQKSQVISYSSIVIIIVFTPTIGLSLFVVNAMRCVHL